MKNDVRYKNSVRKVEKLYRTLNVKIEKFKKDSGIACIKGCGKCCEGKEIEATVLEFLPLAEYLWNTKKADHFLEGIDKKKNKVCFFYRAVPGKKGYGSCSVYKKRGLICRLFGFSAVRDKNGELRIATCRIIRKKYPQKIRSIDNGNFSMPTMAYFSERLSCIDPSLESKFYPINEAIKKAIEYVGLMRQYVACNSENSR